MINLDLNRFIAETPSWFRVPLIVILFVMTSLLAGLFAVLAIAVIEGRGVTARFSGVEFAPKVNACTAYASAASTSVNQDIVESLRGQIAEFSRQAGVDGPNRFTAQDKVNELLVKQDGIARARAEVVRGLRSVCEKVER